MNEPKPNDRKVRLEWYEHQIAAQCGVMRNLEAERNGYRRPEYSGNHSDAINIDAAGAEMATAKFLRRYWLAGVNIPREPDVMPNIEVRHTNHADGRLKVKKDDADDRVFILVRGTMPEYEIVGWIRGRDAKRPEWLDNPNNLKEAYWIPENALHTNFFGEKSMPQP